MSSCEWKLAASWPNWKERLCDEQAGEVDAGTLPEWRGVEGAGRSMHKDF